MRAYLSYQFKDDTSTIVKLLQDKQIEVFDSASDINVGTSFQQAIKNAVKECDFVMLLYTNPNANIAFEAGVASALNKPIFAVVSPESENPDFLFDSTYVHAFPNELDKISFNFNLFYKSLKPKKTAGASKTHKFYGGGEPIFYDIIYSKYGTIDKTSEKQYELFFKDIFELYHLSVIKNKFDSKHNFYADFCIWSDKLSNVLTNPILIEVKKELNHNNLHSVTDNLFKSSINNSANSCIIFYDHLNGINKSDLPNTSKFLFIKISDFLDKLKVGGFNDSIRMIRNEIVHNIE